MLNSNLLLCAVFVPTIGAFAIPFIGRFSGIARNAAAFILVFVPLAASALLAPAVLSGRPVTLSYTLPLGCDFTLTADALAVFMAIVSSFISFVIVLYSFGYIRKYSHLSEYYTMVVFFIGSMMGLVYSANLIFIYLFWEMTAIASWRLIGFFREKTFVLKADKAFLITVFGALLMLLGFILIYTETGSFDLSIIKSRLGPGALSNTVVLLILFGILSKSATLPFHTWLPDAGVAPSPVTALLHAAVLVKIGVYVYARLFVATFSIGAIWHTVVPALAAISALVSAGAALVETDIKRIIAYSTVSQIAFIFLGLAVGGEIGLAGALLYILMHGLAKGGLFLCAGIVEHGTHTKDITKMGGLFGVMPMTAVSFLFCAFSVMGVPPFGGFFSKYMVISGALSNNTWIAMTFLVGAFLTILYLFRLFNMVFMGEEGTQSAREGSRIMVFSVAILGALSLVAGICIQYPASFVETAVKQMLGF
ncbi:MAG: NADH-quinone oxidoreductase subunit L [Candidatus Omnitrophica bacterium]|nr:NADH-quinone oxidoreductase subunit L [Candidatus Omnitrophota bacterium]